MMAIVENGEEFLTAGDAARFLDVSAATFLKFQGKFQLQYYKREGQGQRKFFKKSDLVPLKGYKLIQKQDDKQ